MDKLAIRMPKVVAEIGCNHKGELGIAKELIQDAKNAGADVAKFQKRSNRELISEEQYMSPHPVPENSYGNTYGEHREFLEFNLNSHRELKSFCESIDIDYSTSVWDVTSAKEIMTLQPKFLKIPSACNNNYDLLETLRDEFSGEIHISLGMTTKAEEDKLMDFFSESKRKIVLYHCTSGYPVPPEDICLLEIRRLVEDYGQEILGVGFSGHHVDISIDLPAVTLGASWLERHFTKNKKWKGTDHSASLEFDDLKELINNLKLSTKALTYKSKEILDIEIPQREKLKFSLNK